MLSASVRRGLLQWLRICLASPGWGAEVAQSRRAAKPHTYKSEPELHAGGSLPSSEDPACDPTQPNKEVSQELEMRVLSATPALRHQKLG